MKRLFLATILLILSGAACAANYTLSASWTDPTPADPGYTAAYDGEWRVNGGVVTAISNQPSPAFSTTVVANPGDTIETRVRARNTQASTVGNWSVWFTASAPNPPITPADQTGVVITVVPQ